MSTITKERIANLLQFNSEGSDCQANAEQWEVHELARIALASLEAEPVAWLLSGGGAKNNVSFDSGNAYADPLREVTPLYTAPPAPVSVPDAIHSQGEKSASDDYYALGWNACRAAMLKHSEPFIVTSDHRMMEMPQVEAINAVTAILQGAEPVTTAYKLPAIGWLRADYQDDNRGLRGNAPLFVLGKKDPSTVWGLDYVPLTSNSPVIPDGWVACSDRLPPEGYEPDGGAVCYLVWHKNEVDCGPQYSISNVFFLRKHWEKNFTHWMPLPAAPQQEVR
ncbi:TPA: DUF551 domain-containing protein [Enterobacter hormaechei]